MKHRRYRSLATALSLTIAAPTALTFAAAHPAFAFSGAAASPATRIADADAIVDAYLKTFVRPRENSAFIKGDQNGGDPGFWQEAEEIEGIEDANDRSGGAYNAQVTALLNGFSRAHGTNWADNIYNDDICWATIAYTRAYESTGNKAFLEIAKTNFDLMYARAWNPEKRTLFWTTKNTSYNSCIECPAGIAACLLGKALGDDSYRTKAKDLFAWEKANLFDASTGAVWDAVNLSGKIGTWSSTYNQGTFVGLANYLGDTDSAKRAATYTMERLGKRNDSGFEIMPEYGAGGGNNAGLNSIGLRWISRFMRERSLQDTYLPWLQANANTAWSVRRASDNLSWCQWLRPTPEGVLHSWDCINSVVALQVTAPQAAAQTPPVAAGDNAIYRDPNAPLEARVNDLFDRMTPEERLTLFTGTDFSTQPIPRLGVPIMDMADASQGVRGGGEGRLDGPATYFGSGVLFASSWDRDLARKVGQAVGEELRNKGTGGQVILGPSVNIHRSPLGGRNAEYYSEDPFLAAETAVGYIDGVQSTGVLACVKHFACNNEEVDRGYVNVIVDERTLREIYLPSFEAAVKRGHVRTVMSSYNKVNGHHSSANWYLDTRILRGDWGFDGLVMSDWGGVHEIAGVLNAGNDLEMPGPGQVNAANVADARDSGQVTQATLDESLRRILRTIIRSGVLDPHPAPDHAVVGSPAHLKIAHDAAAEGIILLKNSKSVLPLDRGKVKTVAVFGSRAKRWQMGGDGSPEVRPTRAIFPLDGMTKLAGPGVNVSFVEKESVADAQARAKGADVAVLFVGGAHEGEGNDRPNMELQPADLALIHAVAAVNKNTVVIVSSGAPCKMSDWIGDVPGVVQAPFAGQEGGTAIAEILFGDINPSGKLTDTYAKTREDYPDFGNFPGKNGTVHYTEGIYVGYRHFDKDKIEPTFPFGYGLSYTTFKYSNLRVSQSDWTPGAPLTATVDVTNTGKREGAEVAELYVHADDPKIDRPLRELKGFDRLTLQPGETKTAHFTLDARSFAYCDVPGKQWKADGGKYTIAVGPGSRDLPVKTTVKLTTDWTETIPGIGAPPPPGPKPSLATGKRTLVSSLQEGEEYKPEYATDADMGTRWSSAWSDPQWIAVDLGAPTLIDRVELMWEKARALAYEIQISDDGQTWKSVYSTETGKGSRDVIKLTPVTTRWVRMYGTKRTTTFGYSLYEFNVFGPGK